MRISRNVARWTALLLFWVMNAFALAVGDAEEPAASGVGERVATAESDAALPERFAAPPVGYGEVPFWWWTGEKLNVERLLEQVEALHAKGISGVQVNYAHADTPGWPTYPNDPEIFTDAWWYAYSAVAKRCGELGMGIGLSGYTIDWQSSPKNLFGDIIYNDPAIQSRELDFSRMTNLTPGESSDPNIDPSIKITGPSMTVSGSAEETPEGVRRVAVVAYERGENGQIRPETARLLWLNRENGEKEFSVSLQAEPTTEIWSFSTRRKEHSLNPLHPESGRRVIEKFFQPFVDHSPTKTSAGLNYFFQDELQIGTGALLWHKDLPDEFQKRKGYSIFEALPVFYGIQGGNKAVKYRLDFFDVRVALAEERYFQPIFDWHNSRGMIYACDPGSRGLDPFEFYDYFRAIRWYTAPGHDTPGGHADFLKNKVSSSIAHFYQRPRVWLEGYHSLGWGATPERLLQATCENFIYGANLLNLHGLYYTTYGSHWEWAPPCYHFRMPYWDHFGGFLKYFERLSFLASQGVQRADVVILYPVSDYQADTNGEAAKKMAFEAARKIYDSGRNILFIDDESLARCEVRGGSLALDGCRYAALVLPGCASLRAATLDKALEFYRGGGKVLALGTLPSASDRAGAHDPALDKAVREIFGVANNEIPFRAPNGFSERTNERGGAGFFIAPPSIDPEQLAVREYDGGFRGRWAWSAEPKREVFFKAIWPGPDGEFLLRAFCDNTGTLWCNGEKIADSFDYQNGTQQTVALKTGDVLTLDGRDSDNPPRRGSAGFFFAAVQNGQTLLSSEDFRCTTDTPPENWRTDSSLETLAAVDTENVHPLHRGIQNPDGSPKEAGGAFPWSKLLGVLARVGLPDVEALDTKKPLKFQHRVFGSREIYFVMGAQAGERAAFRTEGSAEIWDPWTGQARPVASEKLDAGRTAVRLPDCRAQMAVVVFHHPNGEGEGDGKTNDELRADTDAAGEEAQERAANSTATESIPLDGLWETRIVPTMNNRWGDFRLPVAEQKIGVEARRFDYAEVAEVPPTPDVPFFERVFAEAKPLAFGYGLKFYRLGPFPAGEEADRLEARLSSETPDVDAPMIFGGKEFRWSPYEFSWRDGIEGNPGHQGWHGLKERLDDRFLGLGAPQQGFNETVFAAEEAGSVYFLATSVRAKIAATNDTVSNGTATNGTVTPESGESASAASVRLFLEGEPVTVWLGGIKIDALTPLVKSPAPTALLLRCDAPGRRAVVFAEKSGANANSENAGGANASGLDAEGFKIDRTPLAMKWLDLSGRLDFDTHGLDAKRPTAAFRFFAPPGLTAMVMTAKGKPRVFVNGAEIPVVSVTDALSSKEDLEGREMLAELGAFGIDQTPRYAVKFAAPLDAMTPVDLLVEPTDGAWGGAIFPEPIRLTCGVGKMPLGDWGTFGAMADYSGGVVYGKTVTLGAEQLGGRVTLELGGCCASARVLVNGIEAGTLFAPPWSLDLTPFVHAGENRIEIDVRNTLTNHYRTIPTNYRGDSPSGLLGPVSIILTR